MNMANLGIIIPRGVENLQLPDDSLLNFYEGLEYRVFWINDEINVYSLNLIHYIMKWNKEDMGIPPEERKPIKLLFFSPGGDIDANYAIIDTIKLSKTPIVGVNIGQCASAAAFIFLSCHQRYMLSHSYFLFHQGSGQLTGSFGEIYAQMEDYQAQVEELASFMATHTPNIPQKKSLKKLLMSGILEKMKLLKRVYARKLLITSTN